MRAAGGGEWPGTRCAGTPPVRHLGWPFPTRVLSVAHPDIPLLVATTRLARVPSSLDGCLVAPDHSGRSWSGTGLPPLSQSRPTIAFNVSRCRVGRPVLQGNSLNSAFRAAAASFPRRAWQRRRKPAMSRRAISSTGSGCQSPGRSRGTPTSPWPESSGKQFCQEVPFRLSLPLGSGKPRQCAARNEERLRGHRTPEHRSGAVAGLQCPSEDWQCRVVLIPS